MNVLSETHVEINFSNYFSLNQKFQGTLWRPEERNQTFLVAYTDLLKVLSIEGSVGCPDNFNANSNVSSAPKSGFWFQLDENCAERII